MNFETRYNKLNTAQQQAVDAIEGPVMVVAGPGTGKTELLSMRVANILKQTDTLPENILCLTFTESGASAMRERLRQIIGPSSYKVAIHTFHSFGTDIINQNGQFFYRGANFRAADELSSYEVIRGIFEELEYTNPLASKMNGEFTHLRDTLKSISELKKSGLTSDEVIAILDQNDLVLDSIEPLLREVFSSRVSPATVDQLSSLIIKIHMVKDKPPIPTITPLSTIMAESLTSAVDSAKDSGKTTAVTAWKNTWLKKNDEGELIFKSRDRAKKLRALTHVYFQYLARMQAAELYDFDDMILRVVHAMEVFPELRYNLQEKYQYLMVDEFQDTNMAQMRILHNLTTLPTGDQPNIMVVGDDDQAIYSFQGAEIGNILSFRDLYPKTKLITLTDNYRSAPVVLQRAREIITQGTERLENHIKELDKSLTAHRTDPNTSVRLIEHQTLSDEYSWLAADVKRRIEEGAEPSSIAVLARRHHELAALLPYFTEVEIAVNYERRDNVLDLEPITLLESLGGLLMELFEGHEDHADPYLPELLSHPAWGFEPTELWQLGLTARRTRKSWLEVMSTTPRFVPLHQWLIETSRQIEQLPLEIMLDKMIGHEAVPSEIFTSPIHNYFFGPEKLEKTPDLYLSYLEGLRTIRSKLTEYQPNEQPRLTTFLEFIQLHRQMESSIESMRPHTDTMNGAINLMTAHKSKGLEFDHVYIIGAVDSSWGERVRNRSSLIGYPENLPLSRAENTLDERLRLFFVAMTRAKIHLTIGYSLADLSGKELLPASFIAGTEWEAEKPREIQTIETMTRAAELRWYQPLVTLKTGTMKELLEPVLAQYRLSATDLCIFLDVTHGGPQAFLLERLLAFPQAASPSAAYGTAIHKTLQRAHAHLSATNRHRAVEDILQDYENYLKDKFLSKDDFQAYLQKGSDALQAFLAEKYVEFHAGQQAELNLSNQHVVVGEARLTGSIDLLERQDKSITVTDYKTGRPVRSWKGTADYEKVKLHRYRQQLMFYKLLVEGARDFSGATVDRSILQFVEPTTSGEIITLDTTFSIEEMAQFKSLVNAVWKRITTMDLPDISKYPESYNGIIEFEKDLLEI